MLAKVFKQLPRRVFTKAYLTSFLLGAALVFSYAPFSISALSFVLMALWFVQLKGKSPSKAAKSGFIFGFGWFAAGISWVHVSIDQFGGMPLPISLLLMLLLCLYLALFPALACFLSARFSYNRQVNLWLLVPCWLIAEYLRATLLTGFPWLSLGYSQIDSIFASFAPLIGEYGLTALVLIISLAISNLISNQQRLHYGSLLILITALALILKPVAWVQKTDKFVSTLLVQGNIEQALKWQPEQTWPTMMQYLDLTRVNYPAELIIWPESAITAVEPSNQAQDFLQIMQSSALINNSAIISGIIDYNINTRNYYNNLIVLGKETPNDQQGAYFYGNSNRYSKHHLLPIGEFVPFAEWLRPLAPFFNLPMSSFSRGNYQQNNLLANGYQLLPLICFEVVFARQLSSNFSEQTQLLLTVSNDAWFGDSHGPHQHLDIVRMRALEFGRPFLRATNNGVTAAVDHKGQVLKQIPQFEQTVLSADIPLVTGITPYAQFTTIIDFAIPSILLLLVLLYQRKQRKI